MNVLDLRGVACPLNYVKAKFELARIGRNAQLWLILDDGAPIKNVVRSLKGDGFIVGEPVANDDESFRVLIRSKGLI